MQYHDKVGRVVVSRDRMLTKLKVLRNLGYGSLIHDATLVHQNQVVKGVEYFRRRLMNRKQNACARVRNLLENLAQLDRGVAIQTARGFVEKNHLWFLQEF